MDSVGINVHLHYTNTLYGTNFPLIETSLTTLGIRHVRDGVVDTTWQPYYDEHNQLGQLGIKSIFSTSVGQSASLFQQYPGRMSQCFEGYENANEYDISGDPNWIGALEAAMGLLSSTVRNGNGSQYPILGPSLTQIGSYPALGNQHTQFDYGNMHNYFGNRNPGTVGWGGLDAQGNSYGSIAYNLDEVAITSPGLPVMTTETGYANDPSAGVPEAVSAVYMPRLLLEQWNAGVKRTYLYELLSDLGQDFGLMRSDGSYKPAFYAVSNLLNLLSDKGASFTPGSLPYTLNGADSNLHRLLMQKQDGTFYLALWLEESSFDPNQQTPIVVTPESIQLQSTQQMNGVTVYQWNQDGKVAASNVQGGTSIPLTVTDKLMLVKLSATTSTNPVNITLASNVPGGWISVDGAPIGVNEVLSWIPGQSHTLSGWSPQSKGGTVYLFQQWISGTTGTTDQVVTTPSVNTTYTGQYSAANGLNAYGTPGGSVSISPMGPMWGGLPYYYPNATVTVTAVPNNGCAFQNWAGDSTSNQVSLPLTMSSYKNVIAVFKCR